MRLILSLIFGIFVIMFVGNILLTEFPSLNPIFEEGKAWLSSMYNMSVVKYGAAATGILIIGLLFLVGDKKR
ncbi:MAG TPA: hypothetical protein VK121_04660 [Pseudogracilibacillus sp.]|nr:hypothetical protein [Pseudogracilibacillus sp.]